MTDEPLYWRVVDFHNRATPYELLGRDPRIFASIDDGVNGPGRCCNYGHDTEQLARRCGESLAHFCNSALYIQRGLREYFGRQI